MVTRKKDDKEELSPRHLLFVEEYLVDLNPSEAYQRAGFAARGASAQAGAADLLATPYIKRAIAERLDIFKQRIGITQERVLREYARLAFLDPRKFFNPDGSIKDITSLSEDDAAALAGLDVVESFDIAGGTPLFTKKLKLADKLKALEMLAKYLDLSKDKLEITGKDGGPVQLEVGVYLPDNVRDA